MLLSTDCSASNEEIVRIYGNRWSIELFFRASIISKEVEGVEKIDNTCGLLPATVKQKELIANILSKIEDADRMHEYYDYLRRPTRENATEFITQALENNLDIIAKKKNYIDYLKEVPGEDADADVIVIDVAEASKDVTTVEIPMNLIEEAVTEAGFPWWIVTAAAVIAVVIIFLGKRKKEKGFED